MNEVTTVCCVGRELAEVQADVTRGRCCRCLPVTDRAAYSWRAVAAGVRCMLIWGKPIQASAEFQHDPRIGVCSGVHLSAVCGIGICGRKCRNWDRLRRLVSDEESECVTGEVHRAGDPPGGL